MSALLRYDAFEDVGGRLSFSCALLDDHGTGVVLTSHQRATGDACVREAHHSGTSSYNLSHRGGGGDPAGPRGAAQEAVEAR